MDKVTILVLGLAVLTTLWMLCYVAFVLPRQFEDRILASVKAFTTAVELRYPATLGLSDEIIPLSVAMGRKLGMSRRDLKDLEIAAGLRDIGLCSVPYQVINQKSEASWTDEEKEVYERHPEVSAAMLEQIPALERLATTVRYHHIPYSVATLPGQPMGKNLGLGPRILKVAVEYVWARKDLGTAEAIKQLQSKSGTEYCPLVLSALKAVLTSHREAQAVVKLR